jgi:hypothetical protein
MCKSAIKIGSGVVFCKGVPQTLVSIETGPIGVLSDNRIG